MDPIITTVSGRIVNVLEARDEDIVIGDIAHALSQVNRFGGHVTRPISVAQHSVFVSYLCDREYALQGLLHDASEAYLGDVTKWLKDSPAFEAYRVAEDELQRRIFRRFGVPTEQHSSVSYIDKRMCTFEAERGGMAFQFSAPGYEATTDEERRVILKEYGWVFMEWQHARDLFVKRFDELTVAQV